MLFWPAAATAALMLSTAQGAVRIKSDPGGQIGPYLENLVALRGSGERVIIDGPCLSACTMVLGVIPRERICVTPRARLDFTRRGIPATTASLCRATEATKLLMDIYPAACAQLDRTARRSHSAHDVSERPRARRDVPDLR